MGSAEIIPDQGTVRNGDWLQANQHALCAALAIVHAELCHFTAKRNEEKTLPELRVKVDAARALYEEISRVTHPEPALETLCTRLRLSQFERQILLVCAGMELDGDFATLCGKAHGEIQREYPTFSLMLSTFAGAHWSALSPDAPLRHWRLIHHASVGGSAGAPVTTRPLHIDERVLHYLTGVHHIDESLAGSVQSARFPDHLAETDLVTAQQVAAAWSGSHEEAPFPLVNLYGSDPAVAHAIAAKACALFGLTVHGISTHAIPAGATDLNTFVRLWGREVCLNSIALVLDLSAGGTPDVRLENVVDHFLEQLPCALIIVSRDKRIANARPVLSFEVARLPALDQAAVWKSAIGDLGLQVNGQLSQLTSHFSLSAHSIHSIAARIKLASDKWLSFDGMWDACREETRLPLNGLAQFIKPTATWKDLVLPEAQKAILQDLVSHVRQRAKVYDGWGFASKGSRGLGISALFVGASGTGKTMAAEVLAGLLRLDLYRVDLSSMVSKYIGETEKNLRRLFDAAEGGGAILLFDEADALFGKRSEVKDSHDRYANIEVSYLLQLMECYRGLAILTTNMKSALDAAFLRRIRFVVQFPFPDMSDRAEIWRRVFPEATPTDSLDVNKLALLSIAGGNIRNIALGAAFLAAEAGTRVDMAHLLHAARSEYAKLEKPLTEVETAGWV